MDCRALLHASVVAVLLVAGCEVTRGSGKEVRQTLEFRDFDSIRADGLFDVKVVIGPEFSVTAIADSNILPLLEVNQVGQTLAVEADGSISPRIDPRVEIVMPTLRSLAGEGTGDMNVSGLKGGRLEVTNDFICEVKLAGTVDYLRLTADDDVDATGLDVREVEIHFERNGEISLGEVSEKLTATGEGILRYHGKPRILELGDDVNLE